MNLIMRLVLAKIGLLAGVYGLVHHYTHHHCAALAAVLAPLS